MCPLGRTLLCVCHFHFNLPSGQIHGHYPQTLESQFKNAALAVAEGLVGLSKEFPSQPLPLLSDKTWYGFSGTWNGRPQVWLKFTLGSLWLWVETSLPFFTPSGFCLCFLKMGLIQEGGDYRGFICVVSAHVWNVCFLEDSEPLVGSAWDTQVACGAATSVVHVKAAMWSVICSTPELFIWGFWTCRQLTDQLLLGFLCIILQIRAVSHPHIPPPL